MEKKAVGGGFIEPSLNEVNILANKALEFRKICKDEISTLDTQERAMTERFINGAQDEYLECLREFERLKQEVINDQFVLDNAADYKDIFVYQTRNTLLQQNTNALKSAKIRLGRSEDALYAYWTESLKFNYPDTITFPLKDGVHIDIIQASVEARQAENLALEKRAKLRGAIQNVGAGLAAVAAAGSTFLPVFKAPNSEIPQYLSGMTENQLLTRQEASSQRKASLVGIAREQAGSFEGMKASGNQEAYNKLSAQYKAEFDKRAKDGKLKNGEDARRLLVL